MEDHRVPRVSLRQADATLFPLFLWGDSEPRSLTILPAGKGQDKAVLNFFYHPLDGSNPVDLGMIRLTGLPDGNVEMNLNAGIKRDNILVVTVRHDETDQQKNLKVTLPAENPSMNRGDAEESGEARNDQGGNRSTLRVVLGSVFLVLSLTLISFLLWTITRWGRQESPPLPLISNSLE